MMTMWRKLPQLRMRRSQRRKQSLRLWIMTVAPRRALHRHLPHQASHFRHQALPRHLRHRRRRHQPRPHHPCRRLPLNHLKAILRAVRRPCLRSRHHRLPTARNGSRWPSAPGSEPNFATRLKQWLRLPPKNCKIWISVTLHHHLRLDSLRRPNPHPHLRHHLHRHRHRRLRSEIQPRTLPLLLQTFSTRRQTMPLRCPKLRPLCPLRRRHRNERPSMLQPARHSGLHHLQHLRGEYL
jgi:hypothetical protein